MIAVGKYGFDGLSLVLNRTNGHSSDKANCFLP